MDSRALILLLLEEFGAREAASLEDRVDAILDAQAYRTLAQEALHVLYRQHRKYDRLYEQHERLVEEYRYLREQVLLEAGAL